MEPNCMSCAVADGSIEPPGGLLYASDSFVMHQSLDSLINGFLIIAPRSHIRSITKLSSKQRIELIDLINKGIKAQKNLDITEEVTIIQEECARHLNVWLFPWLTWMDGKFHKSFTSVKDIIAYAKKHTDYQKIGDVMDTAVKIKGMMNN